MTTLRAPGNRDWRRVWNGDSPMCDVAWRPHTLRAGVNHSAHKFSSYFFGNSTARVLQSICGRGCSPLDVANTITSTR